MQADKRAAACPLPFSFRGDDEALRDAGICREGAVRNLLIGDSNDGDVAVCRRPEFPHLAPAGAGDGIGG